MTEQTRRRALNEQQHKELNTIMKSYFGERRVTMAVAFPTYASDGDMDDGLEIACSAITSKTELKAMVAHLLQMLIDTDTQGECRECRIKNDLMRDN